MKTIITTTGRITDIQWLTRLWCSVANGRDGTTSCTRRRRVHCDHMFVYRILSSETYTVSRTHTHAARARYKYNNLFLFVLLSQLSHCSASSSSVACACRLVVFTLIYANFKFVTTIIIVVSHNIFYHHRVVYAFSPNTSLHSAAAARKHYK